MKLFLRYRWLRFATSTFLLCTLISTVFLAHPFTAKASACTITTDTTINQSYIDTNTCNTIDISGTTTITWSGTTDLVGAGTVTISSGTVTFSGAMVLGATDDFVISSGATVTHAAENNIGVNLTARNITVTGSINTDGKGCAGGSNADGRGPNATTGICAISTTGYSPIANSSSAGAAHGGAGGNGLTGSSTPYDLATAPALLGSGAGSVQGYLPGGSGGGLITINSSGLLTVNGAISASGIAGGGNGVYWEAPGGGSGGSIYIQTASLAGSSTISAAGGNGGHSLVAGKYDGGGGGGGRIALYYTTNTMTLGNITSTAGVRGGPGGGADGTNGTTFLLDNSTDDLTVTSGLDFTSIGDYTRRNITFASGSALRCDTFATLNVSATIALSMTNTTWSCNTVDTVNITAPTWTTSGSTLSWAKTGSVVNWNITNPLTFTSTTITTGAAGTSAASSGIVLTNPIAVSLVSSTINSNLNWTGLASLAIDAGSAISANGKGCPGGSSGNEAGYGPNTSTGICTSAASGSSPGAGSSAATAGGSYGGSGGRGSAPYTGTTYGLNTAPAFFGSSAGADLGQPGGAGGGIVRIDVLGTLTVNGPISATGGNGISGVNGNLWESTGGGSGGSVYLTVATLAGSSTITAIGGVGGDSITSGKFDGGGGGGGRIAISYATDSSTFLASMTAANSATGGAFGGAGDGGALAGSSGSVYSVQTISVSLTAATQTVSEAIGTVTVTAQLSGTYGSDITIPYTVSGTATGGGVDHDLANGNITVLASATTGNVIFNVVNDSLDENDETVIVTLGTPSYGSVISPSVQTITITDNDTAGITVGTISGNTTEAGGTATATIVLNSQPTASVIIGLTSSNTAEGTISPASFTFTTGNWNIQQTVTATGVNDDVDDGNITYSIITAAATSSDVLYGGVNPANISVTNTDNDTFGMTLTELGGATAVKEGDYTDTYTIVLSTQPTASVTVAIAGTTGQATASPNPLTFTTSNWATPQTVTVTAVDDFLVEQAKTDTLTHTVISADSLYNGFSLASVAVAVTDNDHGGSVSPPTIFDLAKTLTVVTPVVGTRVSGGSTVNVGWNYTGQIPVVSVYLSTDNGATWIAELSNINNNNSTSFTTPMIATTQALIKVEGSDLVTVSATGESVPFTIYLAPVVIAPVIPDTSSLPPLVAANMLVKLANDGDTTTQNDAAVYSVGTDGRRHAFPNEHIYFTWYSNFDNVVTISADDLASIPLGSNVTYKPGSRMVKFQTSPKVYAVDRGGLLRWVASEPVAVALYGSNWNTKIDDISDALFSNYTFGTEIFGLADYNPNGFADVLNPSDSM